MKKTQYFSHHHQGGLAPQHGLENVIKQRNDFFKNMKEKILSVDNENIQFVTIGNYVTTVISLTYITN